MEWLWHVTEEDVPLGRVERTRAHRERLLHRAGIVFLLDAAGRVYLTQRADSKLIFPGCHDSSASFHVAHGESYDDAARREAEEELGLALPLTALGTFLHRDPPEWQHVAVYVMRHAGEPIVLDPSEASSGRFLSFDAARRIVRDEPCTPWLREGWPRLVAWCNARQTGSSG